MYKILVDTREQLPWKFRRSEDCEGVETATLATGDYTLQGYEDTFVIERKGSVQEFYNNICTKDFTRFSKELTRMSEFPHAYVILCFTMNDVLKFPWSSNLPIGIKKKIGGKGDFYLRRFMELHVKFPLIKFILAGDDGQKVANSLFKRVCEHV